MNPDAEFAIDPGSSCGPHRGTDSTRKRPCLLISVRNLEEAALALSAGADIVDLKEPLRGPLAPTDHDLWRAVARSWPERGPSANSPLWSAALGESDQAVDGARYLPDRFDFAKAGPSGCRTPGQLRQLWGEVRESLNSNVELVAVAYADWNRADCLPPHIIFELAAEAGLTRCLLDTWAKDGVSSLQILGEPGIRELNRTVNDLRLRWILAGSIRVTDLRSRAVLNAIPDGFGVRGDVCGGTRTESLQADRVRAWRDALENLRPGE